MRTSSPAERSAVLTGLRCWAQGVLSDQAAVELLASCSTGRHIRPGAAWVKPCPRPGWYWLDADALADFAASRHGDEQRVLGLAARLVTGDPWPHRPVVPGRGAAA